MAATRLAEEESVPFVGDETEVVWSMVAKRHDADLADFDTRYSRWAAAQESGDEAEMKAAVAALPTLNACLFAKLAAVDEDEPDPETRATQKRLLVLVNEVNAKETQRRRKRREAQQRHRDRTVLVERKVELPTTCARCSAPLAELKTTGRPRLYCSPACRKASYEDRRAHREGAMQVQVVEKIVTEIKERRIEVPHPRDDCIQAVFDSDDTLVDVIWTLIDQVRDPTQAAFGTDQARFWDLYNNVEVLREALIHRAGARQPPEATNPSLMSKHQRNMQRMTYPHQPRDGDDQ